MLLLHPPRTSRTRCSSSCAAGPPPTSGELRTTTSLCSSSTSFHPHEQADCDSRRCIRRPARVTALFEAVTASGTPRALHLHQLHRPWKSLHRRSLYQGRSRPFLFPAWNSLLFLLLDLCHLPNRLWLACRPLPRQLGSCARNSCLVCCHRRHRSSPRLHVTARHAAPPRHRRVRRLPFLQQNHLAQFCQI